jgi:hypothetical protein
MKRLFAILSVIVAMTTLSTAAFAADCGTSAGINEDTVGGTESAGTATDAGESNGENGDVPR